MKQILTIVILLGTIHISLAQEAYLSVGKNFTTYDYTNSFGESNPNVSPSSGNYYELGYVFPITNKLSLESALTLNEYNATGGDFVNNYSWNTTYLGFQGVFNYAIVCSGDYLIKLNTGLNINNIINGQQKINGQTFDLTKENEFNGLFAQAVFGIEASYLILQNISLGIGYRYSKSMKISSISDQTLNFNNSQLRFNIIMNLNNSAFSCY